MMKTFENGIEYETVLMGESGIGKSTVSVHSDNQEDEYIYFDNEGNYYTSDTFTIKKEQNQN